MFVNLKEAEEKVDAKAWLPSRTLPQICSYRREHESKGEREFKVKWLIPKLVELNTRPCIDGFGNISVTVGKGSSVLHIAHMDSVHGGDEDVTRQKTYIDKNNVLHLEPRSKKLSNFIAGGQGAYDCLGADDGAGIAFMLYLIHHNVAGTYLFTRGEEKGCLGIQWMVEKKPFFFENFNYCIEVDRKGTKDIITEQTTGKCASYAFGQNLADSLNMGHEPSDQGIYTDNAHLSDLIPESINLAAGYYDQHSERETCDLTYLDNLAKAFVHIDVELIPVSRVTGDFEPDPEYPDLSSGGFWTNDWQLPNNDSQVEYFDIDPAKPLHEADLDEVEMWVAENSNSVAQYLMMIDATIEEIDMTANYVEDERI